MPTNDLNRPGRSSTQLGRSRVDVRIIQGIRLQLLHLRLKDTLPLLQRVGRYLVRMNQVGFHNQAFGGRAPKWAPRAVPDIAGVIAELSKGASIDESRFRSRPALVYTGRLRRSIAFMPSGKKTVELYVADTTAATYGARMESGAPTTIPVTQTVRNNLAIYLRSHPHRRSQLGFLFRKRQVTIAPIPRKFLGIPEFTKPTIKLIVRNFLTGKRV